ncbi:MAG: GAF domain-containing protein [Syntrophaceae bacterium]|nr:GAF domain-containing protein [Desulfobacteraceae bacterium]
MIDNKVDIEISADILANWQEIVNILSEIVRVPAALIMRFMDPYIEVFISSESEGNPYHPGDKEVLFGSGIYCETVLKTQDKLLVPDALADVNWKNSPDVNLNMISYLGFPILLPNKTPFGTICVLDNKANEYSKTTEKLMMQLRSLIESHLEMIYINQRLGDKNKKLTDYLMELQAFRGLVPICANCKSIRDNQNNWHPIEHYLIKHPVADFSHGICPECMKKLYPKFKGRS